MPALDVYTEATVFVLGAGASSAYGFPLGPELKSNIGDLPDSELRTFLSEHNIDQATVESFKRDLRDGDYGTIDYFLERKSAIANWGHYASQQSSRTPRQRRLFFPNEICMQTCSAY